MGNPHPTYAHKHGVIQFHEETCMNAWKHHTGSRVLTGGRGRETAGAFQQYACYMWFIGVLMHLMAKYFNLPLRELQREKGIGETGGGDQCCFWTRAFGECKLQLGHISRNISSYFNQHEPSHI